MSKLRSLALVSALVLCSQLLAQAPPSKPSPSLGKPNSQQDETPKKFEYDPQSQKTGTKNLPLIVQVKPWPQSDVEAADIQKKKDDDSSAKRWGIVMGIFSLAIAGGQTYIFKRQLAVFSDQKKMMEKQADLMRFGLSATHDSIAEAKRSTDAAMNAERAWVIDEIRQPIGLPTNTNEIFRAYITFKNWGRVPALLTNLKMRFHTFGLDEKGNPSPDVRLPDIPTYDTEQLFLELGDNGVILAPGQSITIPYPFEENDGRLTRSLWLLLEGKIVRLVCYGIVVYRDGYNVERFTQFCHMWDEGYDPAGIIPNFRRLGPNYYNKAT
jgi:hypothetical protein